MVQRQNICYCFVQVFSLIQYGLSMKRRKFFVEVNCEKIQGPNARIYNCWIMFKDIVKVVSCLSSCRPCLSVAARVSWYEEYGDSLDLKDVSYIHRKAFGIVYLGIFIYS